MATTPDVSELLPGGYPGTPQHEQTINDNAENNESGNYVQKFKDALPTFLNPDENVAENKESRNITGNDTGNGTENKESGNYLEKIKESLPSNPLTGSGAENKESGNYLEKMKESLPSISLTGSGTDNKEPRNLENGVENKESGNYLEKIKESLPSNPLTRNVENGVENKESGNYLEKIKESLPSNPLTGSGAENKESGNYIEKFKESLPSIPFTGSGTENKESKNIEHGAENNAEKSKDDKIRESFPLRFEPNSSLKATDDNDLSNVTNQGSSALGGVGINPAAIIGDGSESPRHPFYRDNPPEAAEGEIDTSHTVKPHNTADKLQTPFDLTRDYNKQKEQEQTAERKAKQQSEEQEQTTERKAKQQSEKKKQEKPERIDLGVKPLGGQQPPLPYKPEEAAGGTDHIQQPSGKTTVVHPEGTVGHKVTKKDKVNATVGKAVGTLKQKIGKLVKNDSLVAKGTEEKVEAAELKKAKEF